MTAPHWPNWPPPTIDGHMLRGRKSWYAGWRADHPLPRWWLPRFEPDRDRILTWRSARWWGLLWNELSRSLYHIGILLDVWIVEEGGYLSDGIWHFRVRTLTPRQASCRAIYRQALAQRDCRARLRFVIDGWLL